MEHLSVEPRLSVSPVAPYLGGKRFLAKRISDRLQAIPHRSYIEPFVGMGGVFLRRPFQSKVEVINDASRDVSTLFRILQRHYEAFMDMLRWQLTSRADFDRLRATPPGGLTDLERAARFLYLQRLAFGGKIAGQNYGTAPDTPGRFDVAKLGPMLEAVHERLSGVTIECLPFGEVLTRYDRPDALFYLDPPYWGCTRDYGDGLFCPADFDALAEQLGRLKGRFILSLNDRPEVRDIFGAFQIESVQTTYTIAAKSADGKALELLITNRGFNKCD